MTAGVVMLPPIFHNSDSTTAAWRVTSSIQALTKKSVRSIGGVELYCYFEQFVVFACLVWMMFVVRQKSETICETICL
jgi:hypothetical protein